MRVDPSTFDAKNVAAAKSPRFVVKIEFAGTDVYLSSHDDITGIPSTHIAGVLQEPSISSQKLNPDQGRAEIGAASFTAIDAEGAVTTELRSRLVSGEGPRDKSCSFYLGYEDLDFSDFVLVGTQIIKNVAYDKGAYRFNCNDIQRSARKDIFQLAETTISATVEPADTTINVSSTAGFTRVYHGTSYTDAASSTVGYFKIKDEIVRYTGTTSTSFTGCTRGALGTTAGRYVADGATSAARREKVTEYVYLELPGPKLAYAILTGTLYDDTASLPDKWHLGIPATLVRTADFTGIGADLWDTADDAAGIVLRFEGIIKTDGKAFLELEVMRLLGLFMPVYADGTLGLRRMTGVLSDAAAVVTLDESNSITVGDLEHDMESLHNSFAVQWNWNGKDYTRLTSYIDATSAARHGVGDVMELKFKGLYGGRHTDALIFKTLDTIRDRYAAPPVRLRVDVLHSLNRIEVGDVVRVRHAMLRDFTQGGDSIDRSFEVQSVTVNHRTGAVSLDLFGSTERAEPSSPTTATSALPDAFYTGAGTDLATVMTITSGVVSGGPYTLAGGADLTASDSIWYYTGDLTIPAGVTVNISGNVQLRIRGYLTVNGTITGVGGGHAGVADNTSPSTVIDGTPGWVGNSRGHDGVRQSESLPTSIGYQTQPCATTQARYASFPYLALEVVGSALLGLPTDLRGTGGGPGGKVVPANELTLWKAGATGAAGGAGLCTITRGFGVGAGAVINLSGANSANPTPYSYTGNFLAPVDLYPGAGGPGGPGSYLCLIDGGLLSAPDLSGRFVSRVGVVGYPPGVFTQLEGPGFATFDPVADPFAGYLREPSVTSNLDLSYSCHRIQYIPAPETPEDDSDSIPPVTSLSVSGNTSGFVLSFEPAPGTPDGAIFEVWEYTAATPWANAIKRMEGATTAFFVPRGDTNTVYVWVRVRHRSASGKVIYSTTTPASSGQPAAAVATAGTYATATPSSVTGSAANASITTPSVTAALVGATATTYSWARVSGSTSISANSASAATTTFTGTSVGAGDTISAVFRCTINGTYTVDVAVSCTNTAAALAVTANPTSLSTSGGSSSLTTGSTTGTASGGAGGYSYAWTRVSGSTGISITSATSASTTFSATGLASGESRTATFRLTVTDSVSDTATADVSVTISRLAMSVSISPTSLYKQTLATSGTTAPATATGANGTPPYSYAWARVSGDVLTINSPSSAATTFTATGLPFSYAKSGTYRVTATDSSSPTPLTATADIVVTVENVNSD